MQPKQDSEDNHFEADLHKIVHAEERDRSRIYLMYTYLYIYIYSVRVRIPTTGILVASKWKSEK